MLHLTRVVILELRIEHAFVLHLGPDPKHIKICVKDPVKDFWLRPSTSLNAVAFLFFCFFSWAVRVFSFFCK